MDRLTEMEVFTRVVENESFTVAAEKLGMSRAMVSKYVIALETRLGVRLLNRTTRRHSLTEAGRYYFERCTGILVALSEADAQVSDNAIEPRGSLRINAPMSFGILHLAPAIRDYLNAHPEVSIDLDLNDRLVDLVDEGYDLAIRIGQLADSSLIASKITVDRLVLCASPDYLKRAGHPKHPSDLEDHKCLIYSYQQSGEGWRFSTAEGELTVKPKGPFRTNSGNVIAQAAIEGMGIARLPTFLVADALRDEKLVVLMPDSVLPDVGIYAVYPDNRFVTAKVRSFIDFMKGRFGSRRS